MTVEPGDQELRYLTYIRDSVMLVQQRVAGGPERFFADDILQDAVIRRLETLTDAAQHLSPALKQRHPEIPWQTVADFRNRLAHGYLNIDLERVWDVIEAGLPPLQSIVEQELRDLAQSTDNG